MDSLEKSNNYKNMSFMQQEEIREGKGLIHVSQFKEKPTLKQAAIEVTHTKQLRFPI